MPLGWVAGATVLAGGLGAIAADNAADTQADSAKGASAVQQHMFDVSREQQQPFMQGGYAANDTLSRLLGIAPTAGRTGSVAGAGATGGSGYGADNGVLVGDQYLPKGTTTKDVGNGWFEVHDPSGQRVGTLRPGGANGKFINDTGWQMPAPAANTSSASGAGIDPATGYAKDNTGLATGYLSQTFGPDQFKAGVDPGYAFRMQQGNQGVMNASAAGSGSLSGPALKALMDYNQASASQEYGAAFDRFQTQQGNIFQRLSSLADRGQASAAGVGNQAVATGGNIGANIIGAGNASAAGQVGVANAIGGSISDLGSLAYLSKKPVG